MAETIPLLNMVGKDAMYVVQPTGGFYRPLSDETGLLLI
jgi:hypothetical protein